MASTYERELRYLLAGRTDAVEPMADRLARADPKDALKLRRILECPFFVLRSAGSLGIDLVALRGEISFPIEVKTSNEAVVRLSRSKRSKEQAEELTRDCLQAGLVPLYAYRRRDLRDGDPWRLFLMATPELTERYDEAADRHGLLYRKMLRYRADVSDDGNYILRWDEGWPLYAFVDYIADWVAHRARGRGGPGAGASREAGSPTPSPPTGTGPA